MNLCKKLLSKDNNQIKTYKIQGLVLLFMALIRKS